MSGGMRSSAFTLPEEDEGAPPHRLPKREVFSSSSASSPHAPRSSPHHGAEEQQPRERREEDDGEVEKAKEATPPETHAKPTEHAEFRLRRRSWTVDELQAWAARLGAREQALDAREAQLDRRAKWLDDQQVDALLLLLFLYKACHGHALMVMNVIQARLFKMSVERYQFLQTLDDASVRRMQDIVRRWLRRRQWLRNCTIASSLAPSLMFWRSDRCIDARAVQW